jgi:uncharacterized protein
VVLPKDFVTTQEGLVFAVVSPEIEGGKILGFLRYVSTDSGWQKLTTDQSNSFLVQKYPEYLYYSKAKAANLHAVPLDRVACHHLPRERLQSILKEKAPDPVLEDLTQVIDLFKTEGLNIDNIGVTGSLLINAQRESSDIDLVIYQRAAFQQARECIRVLITEQKLQSLTKSDWQEAYARRGCDLSFEEYVWHEQRKFNKLMINGRKVDISLQLADNPNSKTVFKKIGFIEKTCKVVDASFSFDFPAAYRVEHNEFDTVVSFTATYQGQALTNEWIRVAGHLEVSEHGERRVVVGSNREATGEYIKVISGHVER